LELRYSEKPLTAPFNRKLILVVEDNYETRQSLARSLELEGYGVLQAADGQSALKRLQEFTPDLILSDLQMPHMSGAGLFEALRQCPQWVSIPFIFLTAHNDADEVLAGRILGVEDYLTKPIETRDLLAIINARLLRAAEIRLSQIDQAYFDTVRMLARRASAWRRLTEPLFIFSLPACCSGAS